MICQLLVMMKIKLGFTEKQCLQVAVLINLLFPKSVPKSMAKIIKNSQILSPKV